MIRTLVLAAVAALIAFPAAAGEDLDRFNVFEAKAKEAIDYPTRIARGRAGVLNELRDPDSAQFRNASLVSTPNGIVVCGEVNARNGFGGYVGFRGFVVADNIAFVEQDGLSGYWFMAAYGSYCRTGKKFITASF